MRPTEFLNRLVSRFADMDESQLSELHADATKDYKERLTIAQSKEISNLARLKEIERKSIDKDAPEPRAFEKITVQDKMIMKCEHWATRYGLALGYIVSIPIIRAYMNGDAEPEGEGGGDDMEFLRLLSAYQKMKKS